MVRSRLVRVGALLVALGTLAACGNGAEEASGPAKAEFKGRGPITLATGKDTSGNLDNQIAVWNKAHPKERVRLVELPESADQQRQQMVQNAQTKSGSYSVLNLDVVWTAEFAANRWVLPIPKGKVDKSRFLKPTVDGVTYRGNQYAVPYATGAALNFYRKDLLDKVGVKEAPKTWAEMQTACDKVLKLPEAKQAGMSCYAGQFEKYEGLTVNFSEAVNSAGGDVVGKDGKPNVDTPEAKRGLDFLANGMKSGQFPKASSTYKEEEARRAFQSGKLVFMRNWAYPYALMGTEPTSKVKGKFDVAPIPGLSGPGVSTLGGNNLAVSAFTKNKATALDFALFMTGEERQRANLRASSAPPATASLYTDPEMVKRYPYMPALKKSILASNPRPQVVNYGDVTVAIQEAAYGAMNGEKSSDQALADLQGKLEQTIKK